MASGPEHYAEAERLLGNYKPAFDMAMAMPDETPREAERRYLELGNARAILDKAQVHATLALAAAMVTPRFTDASTPQGSSSAQTYTDQQWVGIA